MNSRINPLKYKVDCSRVEWYGQIQVIECVFSCHKWFAGQNLFAGTAVKDNGPGAAGTLHFFFKSNDSPCVCGA